MATKHSKFKNTSIIFELLVRKIASDTLTGKDSPALGIIKEFFNKDAELTKELELYRTLMEDKFDDKGKAEKFMDLVLEYRRKLDNKKLSKEKFELVKCIKEKYDFDEFFKARVSDYKTMAAVHMLFESSTGKNIPPKELINSKFNLLEHISKSTVIVPETKDAVIEEYVQMDEDIRLLSYKMLVDKFNNTYATSLNENQRDVLRLYINNITDSTTLREYINKQLPVITEALTKSIQTIEDDVTKIKIQEVLNQLPNFLKGEIINENHILTLLRYQSLVEELKTV
jgi:hypothetical protein